MYKPQLDLELAEMALTIDRPETDPPEIDVSIISPTPGEVLYGSRGGNPDVVALSVIPFRSAVTSVTVVVE